jgi:hypothetical protein
MYYLLYVEFGNNLKDSLNDGYKNYRKSTN